MARKVSALFVCALLIACLASPASAAETQSEYVTVQVQPGSIPSQALDYARSIVGKADFGDNYILWKYDEDVYYLVMGQIEMVDESQFLISSGTAVVLTQQNWSYSTEVYNLEEIGLKISLHAMSNIVYSNLGYNPELITLGEKYEILQTYTLCAVVLFALFVRILGKR